MTKLIVIQEYDNRKWVKLHESDQILVIPPQANDQIIIDGLFYLVKRKLFDFDNNLIKIFVKLDTESLEE